MDTKYAFIGFLRAFGLVLLTAALTYLGDAANLAFLEPQVALLISGIALAIEHAIESRTGNALFGAVRA